MKFNRMFLVTAVCVSSCIGGMAYADEQQGSPCGQQSPPAVQQAGNSEGILQQLENFRHPIQQRVTTCCDELAVAQSDLKVATAERDAAAADMQVAITRVDIGAKILKSMCSVICIDGENYSKKNVAGAVKSLICDYQNAKQVHDLRQQTVTERKTTLHAVEIRVAKWQKAERELLKEISLLKAEHDLIIAKNDQPVRTPQNEIVKAERLLKEITGLLDIQLTTVTTTAAKPVADAVPDFSVTDNGKLIQEVDKILDENK